MLSELRGCSDAGPCWTELEGWSAAGAVDRLEELGHALVALPDSAHLWSFNSTLNRVLELLALEPSAARAAAAVRIATRGPLRTDMVRELAAMLAQGQAEEVLQALLAELLEDDLGIELGACLLHEMVLRRKPVPPDVRRLAGHPLADLAPYPLPGETRLPLADFGHCSKSYDAPFLPGRTDPITLAGATPAASREMTPPDLTAAVTTWLTRSNGKAEAAVFTLAPPPHPDEVGVRTVTGLGLDCLAGGGLALRRGSLDGVLAVLFGAAANGGAYDSGLGGAYGRAAAWRSLDALAGGSHVGCSWWLFDAANDWFHRVAWDFGVVCLRPGGHVMAVLAATDTD